jgi:hypothetical protein
LQYILLQRSGRKCKEMLDRWWPESFSVGEAKQHFRLDLRSLTRLSRLDKLRVSQSPTASSAYYRQTHCPAILEPTFGPFLIDYQSMRTCPGDSRWLDFQVPCLAWIHGSLSYLTRGTLYLSSRKLSSLPLLQSRQYRILICLPIEACQSG